jgi:hypothetical protein
MTFVGKGRAVLTGELASKFSVYDTTKKKANLIRTCLGHNGVIWDVAPSPDNRYLVTVARDQTLRIWSPDQERALLALYVRGEDWIIWSPKYGYYAATPGGERLVGWSVDSGIDKMPRYYPAERFRKALYRPDIIKLIFEKGSVEAALMSIKEKAVEIERALPPRVRIESLDFDKNKRTVNIKVATESSEGQPIKALRLLVDGRSFPDGKYSLENPSKKELAALRVDGWSDVHVPPGKHELKILIRGPDSADISEPKRVGIPPPDEEKPVMHIIAVGVDKYSTPGLDLKAAANDAKGIREALGKNCAGEANYFRKVEPKTLLNEEATTENVLKALADVRKKGAKPGDLVVFFFAGHGMRETVKRDGKDTAEFFLLTHEAIPDQLETTALAGSTLRDKLKDMPCQVLLVLDACHSGAGIGKFVPITDDLTRSMTDDEAAVTVLAAALPHETAGEEQGNGRLTLAVKNVLAADKDAFFDREEGIMRVSHLYAKVYDLVWKDSKGKQNPMLLSPWTMPPLVIRKIESK